MIENWRDAWTCFHQFSFSVVVGTTLIIDVKALIFFLLKYCVARICAYMRRVLEVACHHSPPFACASLYLTSEIIRAKPWTFSLFAKIANDNEDLVEDARIGDQDKTARAVTLEGRERKTEEKVEGKEDGEEAKKEHEVLLQYDPHKRDPHYSAADLSCSWEIDQLRDHYHPSVRKWAELLLEGNPISYSGDALIDFSMMAFLDRFSFKNPKQAISEKGGSLMQRHTSRYSQVFSTISQIGFTCVLASF